MRYSCPLCKIDLRGPQIPDSDDYYSRIIIVEIPEIYDGGLFYQCPECGARWHRWPEGHRLRRRAEPYVQRLHPIS